MKTYTEAGSDVATILLVIAGSGVLKEVLVASGVSVSIAQTMQRLPIDPLVLGWLVAAIIRACVGSATVAGLTAAGLLVPVVANADINPNLMVLSIGAGSLAFSHVNDGAFWLFKEYFRVSLFDTLRTWSVMETIVSLVGLAGVLLLDQFLSL
jgi:Gnt-I system high-affinity gluconate transporter